jgi:hypothetical protein
MGSLKTQQENLSVSSIGGCLGKGYAVVSMSTSKGSRRVKPVNVEADFVRRSAEALDAGTFKRF